MSGKSRAARRVASVIVLSLLAGCLSHGPQPVAPADIPQLEARLRQQPENAQLRLQYAAALFAAKRCDQAVTEARRAQQVRPADAGATLIVGECAEQAGRYEDALGTYRAYITAHSTSGGVAAVRAREQIALRAYANQQARAALANEQQLAQQPGDPNTVAVLPVTISSPDSSYRPLARGLAELLISDLGVIQRFRLVERLRLTALLDELKLGQTARVDPQTAARVGHLVRAGRMVDGLANIPAQGDVRLEASVVQPSGEVTAPQAATGPLKDLLKLEKQVVVGLSGALGYQLSEAERRRILENGTQNLAAFLAYSRGLEAADAGDYSRAAAYFGAAVRADPGFSAAQQQYQSTSVSNDVQSAPPTQAAATSPPPEPVSNAMDNQLLGGGAELSPTVAENNQPSEPPTQSSVSSPASAPSATVTTLGTPATSTGTIHIFFRLP
jgi:tetratricopeptide (TPR) repeat protein